MLGSIEQALLDLSTLAFLISASLGVFIAITLIWLGGPSVIGAAQ